MTNLNIILILAVYFKALGLIDGKLISSKVDVFKNKRLNESEWAQNLRKSHKCLDQILCVSYCINDLKCNLVEYDSKEAQCKQYYGKLTNESSLIDSASTNVLCSLKPPVYNTKGIFLKTIYNNSDKWAWVLTLLKNGNLVSGSIDGYIRVWNSSSGSDWPLIKSWKAHTNAIRCLLVLDNGNLVSGAEDASIKMWNTINWSFIRSLNVHTGIVLSLVSFLNGNIVSGSIDKTFKIWNPNNGAFISSISTGHQIYPLIVLDNKDVVTGGYDDYKIKIWNYNDFSLKATLIGHTNLLLTLLELNNGDLASGAYDTDKRIIIWDLRTYTIKRILEEHNKGIFHLIQLQNGDLASASLDNSIVIWNSDDWTCAYTINVNLVLFMVQLPSGYLAGSGRDGKINIWL